jgi:hypothetical protein
MNLKYPVGWYLYSGIVTVSSAMIFLGLHREFYAFLRNLSTPELMISCLTGLTNLGWYEIAYLVGGGLKTVVLFTIIPFAGCVTGLMSGSLLLTSARIRQYSLWVHVLLSLILGLLGLLVLLWRMVRNMEDPWRLVATISFILFYLNWLVYFQRTRHFFTVVPDANP